MKAKNTQPQVPRMLVALKPYNFPGPERYTKQGIYEAAARVIVERRKGRTEGKENRVRARRLSKCDAEEGSKRTELPCEYCGSMQGESHGKDCPLAAADKRKEAKEMQKAYSIVDDGDNDEPICEFCGETGGHGDEPGGRCPLNCSIVHMSFPG